MPRRKTEDVGVDPSRPECNVEIGGKTYALYFDFAALAAAERRMREHGENVNMLSMMDLRSLGAERLPILFYAALLRKQPNMTLEDARGLVTIANFPRIYHAVVDAYALDVLPRPKPEDNPANPPVDHAPE